MLLHLPRTADHYVLTPAQRALIDSVGRTLSPDRRHSFLLRCLRMVRHASPSPISGPMLDQAIAAALDAETAA